MAGHTSWIRREPIGVVAQVTPWNYPLMMAVWKIAPALAAGNTVVLKPSDTTPVTTVMLAEVAGEIFPAGVLNVICGDRDTGRSLVSHPVPQMVAITGSVRAGREVAAGGSRGPQAGAPGARRQGAGHRLRRRGRGQGGRGHRHRRLLQRRAGLHGRHPGAGRTEVYGDVVDALAEQAGQTTFGGLDQPDVDFGPLNNPAQLERVAGMVARAPDHARVVVGGEAPGGPGFFFPRRSWPASSRATSWPRPRSSGRSSPCNASATRTRPWRGPTGSSTAWRRASGRRTTAGPCGCRDGSTSAACGSTPTSRWSPRCRTVASSTPGYGKDLSMYGLEDYTRIKHVMSNID